MKEKLHRLGAILLSPTAIGFYVTFVFVWVCFLSYIEKDRSGMGEGFNKILNMAHLKSIDYRLQVRGPRAGAPNLGLLAIDEQAVRTLGRWPWSRDIIAEAVDRAFHLGAKVLAFDVVFSEPSRNPGRVVYDQLKSKVPMSQRLDQAFQNEIQTHDDDQKLADVFAKYSNRIVAGAFFTYRNGHPKAPPYMDFCNDLIFHMTPQSKIWDQENAVVALEDPLQNAPPFTLYQAISDVLEDQKQKLEEQSKMSVSKNEQFQMENEITGQLYDICFSSLATYADGFRQIWASDIRPHENPNDFKYDTYDEWLKNFKQKGLPNAVPNVDGWRMDTPKIAKGTTQTGYFNAFLDNDGVIRSSELVVRSGQTFFPSLSLKAYLVATNRNATVRMDWNPASGFKEIKSLKITDNDTGDALFSVPVDRHGRMMINYAGPKMMFPYISIAELFNDSPTATITQRVYDQKTKSWQVERQKVSKADFFKNRIFIVGATATGIFDLRVTPFDENYAGAETHLNVISNLLNQDFMRPWKNERLQMPIVLLAVGVSLTIVLSFLGALGGLIMTLSSLAAVFVVDKYYLFDRGIVVTIIWPLLLIVSIYFVLNFYRYLTEERGKKELRQTFQKYVSPAIVEEILSHPKNIELGGRKANVTVFFSDVRGFTTISEKLDPRALSDLLNSYLTPMTELVFKNRGTLDKYMGDAIMAFFGAPIAYTDHAAFACRCALESVKKLKTLQEDYERKGLPRIDIGIGLNTGEVSVGNMGSESVRSYTVMGDAVNLASRLEGINKQYGTRIILSEFTYNEVKNDFMCREVDRVRVKGKILPVKIYELIGEDATSTATKELLKWFQEGYYHYHEKSWSSALDCFSKSLNMNPDDSVSKLYIERCRDYLIEPPPPDWDGVFVMKTK